MEKKIKKLAVGKNNTLFVDLQKTGYHSKNLA